MWPFSKKQDAPNEALDRLEKKIDDLLMAKTIAEAESQKFRTDLATANESITKLKSQVRAQNEADLYLVSAKIMRDILEKGKPQEVDIQRQSTSEQARQQYQAAQQFSAYGGLGYASYAGNLNSFSHAGRIFG